MVSNNYYFIDNICQAENNIYIYTIISSLLGGFGLNEEDALNPGFYALFVK